VVAEEGEFGLHAPPAPGGVFAGTADVRGVISSPVCWEYDQAAG